MNVKKYKMFARFFEYPSEEWINFVKNCEFTDTNLNTFKERVNQLSLSALEEIYTRTFDLQAICYPYAGYQLFGEDYRRGEFMAKLKDVYRASGFVSPEDELPDHIGVIFKYLSHNPDDEVIVEECLIPVFEKFLESFKETTDNPYYFLLKGIFEGIFSRDRTVVGKEEKKWYRGGIQYE